MKQSKAYPIFKILLAAALIAAIFSVIVSCNIFGEYNNPKDPKNNGGEYYYYSVSYNANGATSGTVPVDSNSYAAGATVTVLGNTGGLTKTGYTFAGWNTKADGTGTSYTAGSTFTMGSANVTLYARWNPLTYSVTYDANGATSGTVPVDNNSYAAGSTVTVLGNTGGLAKTGYTFAGWNTKADGTGTSYAAGSTFAMGSANMTLYAKWNLNTTVRIDGNAMWNNYVYYSWQNRTHVYQPDNTNAVIDTWKVDDNRNGDPRDDLNRILWNGKNDNANGIWFGIWHHALMGQESGWRYRTYFDNFGNGVVEFTKEQGTNYAIAKYTLKPDSDKLYGELTIHTESEGTLSWGIAIISGVWVSDGLGELELYDKAYLNGDLIQAQSSASYGEPILGVDYLESTNVKNGTAAIISSNRSWETVFKLLDSTIPVKLKSEVRMRSIFGGWGFDRDALINVQLYAGDTITVKAIFDSNIAF